MGYVPPTLEEWQDTEKLRAWARRGTSQFWFIFATYMVIILGFAALGATYAN